jgi:hypothetical protein
VIKVFPYHQEVTKLLDRLKAGGWKVEVEGARLVVKGDILPEDLIDEIKSKKELIIQHLTGNIKKETNQISGDHKVVTILSEPKTCYSCGGHSWWISKHDAHLRCIVCHPPADPELVAGRINFLRR